MGAQHSLGSYWKAMLAGERQASIRDVQREEAGSTTQLASLRPVFTYIYFGQREQAARFRHFRRIRAIQLMKLVAKSSL